MPCRILASYRPREIASPEKMRSKGSPQSQNQKRYRAARLCEDLFQHFSHFFSLASHTPLRYFQTEPQGEVNICRKCRRYSEKTLEAPTVEHRRHSIAPLIVAIHICAYIQIVVDFPSLLQNTAEHCLTQRGRCPHCRRFSGWV